MFTGCGRQAAVQLSQLQRCDYALCELTRLLVSDFFADHLANTLTTTASLRSCVLLSAILY